MAADTVLVCLCGCGQNEHHIGKKGCKHCPDCTRFRLAEEVPAELAPVVEPIPAEEPEERECTCAMTEAIMVNCEVHGYDAPDPDLDLARPDPGPGASTSARLREVERECEQLRENERIRAQVIQERNAERRAVWEALGIDTLAPVPDAAETIRGLIAARDELRDQLNTVTEAIPCGWCDGLGVAPAERFGRDADGAPKFDEDRPCPEGCQVPGWLQAERNDAADDARLLTEARAEIERLKASADGYLLAGPDGASLLDQADATGNPKVQHTSDAIRELIAQLREELAEHHRLEQLRAELEQIAERAAEIRRLLADAEKPAAIIPDRTVRIWARKNGYDVDARGRASMELRAAYLQANPT